MLFGSGFVWVGASRLLGFSWVLFGALGRAPRDFQTYGRCSLTAQWTALKGETTAFYAREGNCAILYILSATRYAHPAGPLGAWASVTCGPGGLEALIPGCQVVFFKFFLFFICFKKVFG